MQIYLRLVVAVDVLCKQAQIQILYLKAIVTYFAVATVWCKILKQNLNYLLDYCKKFITAKNK